MADNRKFVDLDAAYAEQDSAAEPLVVRLFGEEWELSGSIPAAVTLRLMVWQEKGWIDDDGNTTADVTVTEMMGLLRDLVPAAVLDEWLRRGLGTDKLELTIYTLIGCYEAHLRETRGAEGEAAAPGGGNRASRRSSNGGRSSKPTSKGSTGSKSRKR